MPFYAIMVAAFVLECFLSILGASFTCIGLCDCKKKQDNRDESLVYVQLNPHVQTVRSTGTSGGILPGDLITNGSQVPNVMTLDTAVQPFQLTNHLGVNSSKTPIQFIPTAQVSQMNNSSGQMTPSGQVILFNTSDNVTPHMLNDMGSTQATSPPSYTVSS
ncbi:hypothetical protein HOLleu_40928 [Holothuria leucospilota]|uniref:Uncharacterized protein n=1 Tax=Holothuria leucospilota TaxID=206669 RepID=A0A9Q0YE17_HOLLE|nr:hypothetical protein HOLleu_40928 [Holothuria leucospilota]